MASNINAAVLFMIKPHFTFTVVYMDTGLNNP